MRKRLFEIIEVSKENDTTSLFYDMLMISSIILSVIPLAFKENSKIFLSIEIVTTSLFIIDYFFRLITADYKLKNKGFLAFILYPFTFWAIIDLISILPTLTMLNSGFKLFKLLRVVKTFRIFKALRYSKKVETLKKVYNNSKGTLIAVVTLSLSYIFISALIVFNVEPNTFDNFFDAVYWATISLTTVGYGDIYPVTTAGRVVTMISSIMGVVIIALPSGIITAGYLEVIKEDNN